MPALGDAIKRTLQTVSTFISTPPAWPERQGLRWRFAPAIVPAIPKRSRCQRSERGYCQQRLHGQTALASV